MSLSRATAWSRAVACGAIAATVSCGPRLPAARPLPHAENRDRPLAEAAEIEVLQAVDRPTLQMVRRAGDPAGAMGVAIFPPRGSIDTVALAALLRLRLGETFPSLVVQVHSLAVLVLVDVTVDTEAKTLTSLADALLTPVTQNEAEASQALELVRRFIDKTPAVSPFDACRGSVGAEGAENLRLALPDDDTSPQEWLESIRKTSVIASRLGLSAVGEGQFLALAEDFQQKDWPLGEPVIDAWDATTSVLSGNAAGKRELLVALRVSDSERALAAARALREPTHPLHARLYAYSARYEVADVDVTLRPAGACLAVRMNVDSLAYGQPETQLSGAALLVAHELEGAVEQSLLEEERTLALLSPLTARETAALAAWTAVRSATTGTVNKRIVEYRGVAQDKVSGAALLKAFERTESAWEKREIPAVQRDERGQSQFWMMVASPCGTRSETNEQAGLRALSVRALARNFSARRGVTIDPWISHAGIGLLAHGPKMRGETPEEHGARVARALGAALFGEALDGRTVAQVRTEQLQSIGSDPGEALLSTVLGGEHAAMLFPNGTDLTVGALATADVEAVRNDLVREPLSAAVLSNAGKKQGEAATLALSLWLASAREHTSPCPEAQPSPAPPGKWSLQTIEEGVVDSDSIGLFAEARPSVGFAYAEYLNQLGRPWAASWHPSQDRGALVVRLKAPEDRDKALVEARVALDELARTPLIEGTVDELRQEFDRRQRELSERPEGRIVQLWQSESVGPPTAAELNGFSPALSGDKHRVVRVFRRK